MRLDGRLGTGIATFVAVAALVATASVTVSSRSAMRRARHRAESQDALIASLTAELESMRRERSRAPTPVTASPIAVTASPATPRPAAEPAISPPANELERRDREIARLMNHVAELEADRARREERAETAASRMQAWRDRMQQDPEALERRRQEGREMLTQAADTTRDRLLFMQAMPADGLAPEYLENHVALLERLAFFDATMQQIAADPEDPANRELMPDLFANLSGLDDMLRMQRTVLLDDLARDIGYETEGAAQFVEAVNTITEMTTLPSPGFLRRGLGGGRRGAIQGQP